jgi:hypothetical protein
MSYGRMTHATIDEQIAEAQRLMQESAANQRSAELEETHAAHAVTTSKLKELEAK